MLAEQFDDEFCLFLYGEIHAVVEAARDNRDFRSVMARLFQLEKMSYAVGDCDSRVFVNARRKRAAECGGEVLCDRRLFGEN